MKLHRWLILSGALALLPLAPAHAAAADKALNAAVSGEWRTDKDKARDVYRHPVESLTFWGLKPGMTILEVQPGARCGGRSILAPYAKRTGGHALRRRRRPRESGAVGARPQGTRGFRGALGAQTRICTARSSFVNWGPKSAPLPADTFDFILTARSVHNWMSHARHGSTRCSSEFYVALKPGGILGARGASRESGTAGSEGRRAVTSPRRT